jgi:hypothetical protein
MCEVADWLLLLVDGDAASHCMGCLCVMVDNKVKFYILNGVIRD